MKREASKITKEADEISGVDVVLPMKWEYSICIVPFEDFYDQN